MCKKKGLSPSGSKEELLARVGLLVEIMDDEDVDEVSFDDDVVEMIEIMF